MRVSVHMCVLPVLVGGSRSMCLDAQLRLSTQMLITALVSSGRVVLNLVLPTDDITNTSANARKHTPMHYWCMCAKSAKFSHWFAVSLSWMCLHMCVCVFGRCGLPSFSDYVLGHF